MDFQYIKDYLSKIKKEGLSQRDIISMESYLGENVITSKYNLAQFTKNPSDRGIDKVEEIFTSMEEFPPLEPTLERVIDVDGIYSDPAKILMSLRADLYNLKQTGVRSLGSLVPEFETGTVFINDDNLVKVKNLTLSEAYIHLIYRHLYNSMGRVVPNIYDDSWGDYNNNEYSWKIEVLESVVGKNNWRAPGSPSSPSYRDWPSGAITLAHVDYLLRDIDAVVDIVDEALAAFQKDYSKAMLKFSFCFTELNTSSGDDETLVKIRDLVECLKEIKG